ncbi:MAG: TonB-dependent receptor plug domain-containing protein, partial [Rhizomicrobium sp.]
MQKVSIGSALLATTMLAGLPAFAQQSGGLETVVVTAQKRSEDVQKVPMTVNALTSQKLEDLHLTSMTDFARYLPNVTYAESGQGSNGGPGFQNITMRGIASDQNGNHSGPEPTVGVYFDEQPITTINGTLDVPAYDISRVEALSGPQGTLYGASAESGVIRIISNKPDPTGFAADFEAGIDAVDHGSVGAEMHGMINQPLGEHAAIRIVAWSEHDAGYIDNVLGTRTYDFTNANPAVPGTPITISNAGHTKNNYNTINKTGARAALGIELNDSWTITPSIMVQGEDSNGVFAFDPKFAGDLKVQHFLPEYVHDNWWQAALTVQGKIGDLDLTYAGAYMDRQVKSAADYTDYTYWYDQYNSYYVYFTDNAGNQIDPTQRILGTDHFTKESQELRLATPTSWRLHGVAGLFYEGQKHGIIQDYVIENLAGPGSGQPVTSVDGWPSTLWLTDE